MAKLIIEVLNRLGHCTERHQFEHLPVRIGRGYHNDLIIADPHVSPDHMIVQEDENGWHIEDCSSLNGVQIRHHGENNTDNLIGSGDDVILGHTRLRFYAPGHALPATQPLSRSKPLTGFISHPATALGLLFLTLGALIINQQLVTNTHVSTNKLIASVLPSIISAMFWAGIWSFVGRLIRHRTSYIIQFSASILFVLVVMLINNLSEYITFITSSIIASQAISYLLTGVALFTLLYVNFENATAISRKARLVASHAITWSLLLFALFMDYAGQPDFNYSPTFPSVLKPPFAHITRSMTVDDYLKDSESIFITDDNKMTGTKTDGDTTIEMH